MATVYLPSGGLGPHAVAHAETYGVPTIVSPSMISYDWSGGPPNISGTSCGVVTSGGYDELDSTFYEYNIAIPNRGGRVAFTITTANVGEREQISFAWTIGDLTWRIRQGYLNTDQCMTSGNTGDEYLVPYPWTGSCNYLLWFPSGIEQPARLDFDGGSIWMRLENGFGSRYVDIAPYWESGGDTTTGPPWPGPGFPFPPNDPKAAQCFVSNIFIEAWDPTAGVPPFGYPWAVATDAGWYGTYNLAASGYLNDLGEIVYDWSPTYPVRLGG